MSADIVVVGSYNLDLVLTVERLPAPGETCLSLSRGRSPGGKGSNQAVQAARCGARVAMLAAIGADPAGSEALQVWADAGIDGSSAPRLEVHPTGMAVILVEAGGENSIVVDAGANARLSPAHIEAATPLIAGARLVLAQLETPWPATRRAFEIARASGVTTALNAAPARPDLEEALLALTDILFVNEIEAAALAGVSDPMAAGERLLAQVGQAVVVTRGGRGAALFRRDETLVAQGAYQVDPVDTTGAGDAFIGAFVAELVASGDAERAMGRGQAAGALACASLGAVNSFADADAIAAFERAHA
ncbi:MAG: ribokinase [Alphaproteobacteria bacterium]|nr:ribokinase [Alphaproteobacteria bacterium]